MNFRIFVDDKWFNEGYKAPKGFWRLKTYIKTENPITLERTFYHEYWVWWLWLPIKVLKLDKLKRGYY